MNSLEDRLRRELPALADALREARAERSSEMGKGAFEASDITEALDSRLLDRRQRWLVLAAVVIVVVVVGAIMLNALNRTEVTTTDLITDGTAPPQAPDAVEGGILEELSVDPTLQWTEFNPRFEGEELNPSTVRLHGLRSLGDGRVVARTWHEEGGRVVVTSDGVNWEYLPLPEDVEPRYVNFSGDRWFIAGTDPRGPIIDVLTGEPPSSKTPPSETVGQWIPPGNTIAQRVFFSDDEGTTWTELKLDVPELATQEPCVDLLLVYWYPEFGEPSWQRVTELVDEGWPECSLALSELVLLSALAGRTVVVEVKIGDPMRLDQIATRVFLSDESEVELVGEWDDEWIGRAIGTQDMVVLEFGDALLVSSDGRVWSEVTNEARAGTDRFSAGPGADGTIWVVAQASRFASPITGGSGEDSAAYGLQELLVGGSTLTTIGHDKVPTKIAVLGGVNLDGNLAVGAGGLAATATTTFVDNGVDAPQDTWVGWSPDGAGWEWQTVTDAFGIVEALCPSRLSGSRNSLSYEFAVGGDFVLANVDGRCPESDSWSRWFIAEVPASSR